MEQNGRKKNAANQADKVLVGEDGWLFLDHDTNRSVDQYLGRVALSDGAKSAWETYFSRVVSLREELNFTFVQMFAPSKEIVYEDFYPHRHNKGQSRPIHEVLKLVPESITAVYPFEALRPVAGAMDTFDRGDTHWNEYGASVAAHAAFSAVGCETRSPKLNRYVVKVRPGDLDTKIPGHTIGEQIFSKRNPAAVCTFKSSVENRGKVEVIENPTAPDRTLVIFGDSFGTRLQLVLRDDFRRIVHVHAHSLDASLLRLLRPDVVLAEMVDRFVISPPSDPATFQVVNILKEKFARLSQAELEKIRAIFEEGMSGPQRVIAEALSPALPPVS